MHDSDYTPPSPPLLQCPACVSASPCPSLVLSALGSDDILALYHDNDARLQLVFDKYSRADDRAGGGTAALCVLLNITEFRMLLRDAGLLGGNNSKGVILYYNRSDRSSTDRS